MIQQTKVVNIKNDPCDIYIGRGTIWGNPYRSGIDGTRSQVIEKYRTHAKKDKKILKNLSSLKGKILGCHCKPKSCHGDVLLEMLKELDDNKLPI